MSRKIRQIAGLSLVVALAACAVLSTVQLRAEQVELKVSTVGNIVFEPMSCNAGKACEEHWECGYPPCACNGEDDCYNAGTEIELLGSF